MKPDMFAVGTNKGVVCVFNMLGKTFHKTKGHNRAVTDLHWCASALGKQQRSGSARRGARRLSSPGPPP